MTSERRALPSDVELRLALTRDPAVDAAARTWTVIATALEHAPQRDRGLIAWPWSPIMPGLPAAQGRRSIRALATLVALALVLALSIALIGLVGSRPAPSPVGLGRPGLVAYDAGGDIYVSNPDGTGARDLTGDEAWDIEPRWSPDGRRIAYQSYSADRRERRLMVVDPTGATATTLATHPTMDPGENMGFDSWRLWWAPDSRSIVYSALVDGRSQILVADADGKGTVVIGDQTLQGSDPAWSPDGTRIAFRGGRFDDERGVYVMDADGTNVRRLTKTMPGVEIVGSYMVPTWSPDSRLIGYHRVLSGHSSAKGVWTSMQVWVIDVDGGTEWSVSDDLAANQYATFSPDGRHIAYLRWMPGEGDRFVVTDLDGSHAATFGPGIGGIPMWSPDGRKLFGHATNEGVSIDDSIAVLDLASGTTKVFKPGGANGLEITGDGSWQSLSE
jgi:Tol biopolymer transport system component